MSVSESLDDVNSTADLIDSAGAAVSITNNTGSALRDNWLYVKPVLAGGGGNQPSTIRRLARIS